MDGNKWIDIVQVLSKLKLFTTVTSGEMANSRMGRIESASRVGSESSDDDDDVDVGSSRSDKVALAAKPVSLKLG